MVCPRRRCVDGTAERNVQLEAMAGVVNREMPVLLEANGERDIRNAVEWAEKQNIRLVRSPAGGRRGRSPTCSPRRTCR